jgi:hypothetical protein
MGEKQENYLLSFLDVTPKIKLNATKNDLTLNLELKIYAKIVDDDAPYSDATYTKNVPLSKAVIKQTENTLTKRMEKLVNALKESKCDFFNLSELLYRFNYKHYFRYKDNYLDKLTLKTFVSVSGQK